jgi:hypothetical protein
MIWAEFKCISSSGEREREREREREIEDARLNGKVKGKAHPCTGTEALYRPYGP